MKFNSGFYLLKKKEFPMYKFAFHKWDFWGKYSSNSMDYQLCLSVPKKKVLRLKITAAPVSTCVLISSSISALCLFTIWGKFIHLFTNGALCTFLEHIHSLIENTEKPHMLFRHGCLLKGKKNEIAEPRPNHAPPHNEVAQCWNSSGRDTLCL